MAYGKLTTQIDPKLHEKTRLEALKRGTTMRALVEEGLQNVLGNKLTEVKLNKFHKDIKDSVGDEGSFVMEKEKFEELGGEFNPQPKPGKKPPEKKPQLIDPEKVIVKDPDRPLPTTPEDVLMDYCKHDKLKELCKKCIGGK